MYALYTLYLNITLYFYDFNSAIKSVGYIICIYAIFIEFGRHDVDKNYSDVGIGYTVIT